MIRSCPNCAAKLIFDPNLGALSCDMCGGIYDVEEFDSEYGIEEEITSEFDTGDSVIDREFAREAHKRMMDINVFSCSSCGADIVVSNTESSTFCIYCGNPNIVFSRIKTVDRPEAIIPFSVSKEVAEVLIKARLKKGLFVPKELKNFKPEALVGIYVPYRINSIMYRDTLSMEYYVTEQHGKNSRRVRRVHAMSGACHFDRLTTDACYNFNNELSYRVEPFDLTEIVPFEEDYLLGFYSDIPDVDDEDSFNQAADRAKDVVTEEVMNMVEGTNKKILISNPEITKVDEPILAMFPMWFVTFKYNGENLMAFVNGQTGKVVAGIPLNKPKLITTSVLLGILFIALSITGMIGVFFANPLYSIYAGLGAFVLLTIGILNIRRARKSLMRSKSTTSMKYAFRRQGGQ